MSNISQNEAVPEPVTGIIERRMDRLEEKLLDRIEKLEQHVLELRAWHP